MINFKDFVIAENLVDNIDRVFESGLISGKYDFSELTEACVYTIDKLTKTNFKPPFALFRVDIDPPLQKSFKNTAFSRYYNEKELSKNNGIKIIYEDAEDSDINLAYYVNGGLFITSNILNKNKIFQEMVISHEMIHALDPGLHSLDTKSPFKNLDADKTEDLQELLYNFVKSGNRFEYDRAYMRKHTEVEAHIEMFVYILNFLLKKHPEKIEKVKSLLRKGEWKLDSIFPELSEIIHHVKDRIDKFQKVKTKMLQRLGTLVSELKPEGIKPKFEVIIPYKGYHEMNKIIKDIELKFPSAYMQQTR